MILYKFIDNGCTRQEEHIHAHGLLGYGLKNYFGITDHVLARGRYGKPYIDGCPEIGFNISHCKGLVICGFSGHEIGADAELIRDFDPKVMKRIFSDEERGFVNSAEDRNEAFFRIWTLKEALGKYTGKGIFSDMKKYSFSFENGTPVCADMKNVFFTQIILQKKWIVSVCANDPENNFIQVGQ